MRRSTPGLGLAFAFFVTASFAFPPQAPRLRERPRRCIDVAFCIDTTGSMQPYIDAVRARVREIARGILQGEPRPIVRFAVVAYRDRGDQYLTRKLDFTGDVEAVETYLTNLVADGGGDEPEHVTAGLRECVDHLAWTDTRRTVKSVYLVGDAPAHVDYDDGNFYPVIKAAIARGIIISTIACAGRNEVAQWQEIAHLADGQFFLLPQAGPATAVPATMSATLRDSVIGDVKKQARARGVASY